MEYQFIRDPITGFRVKISDEHMLVGRWLSEELPYDEVMQLVADAKAMHKDSPVIVKEGKEIRFTLSADEALFEAHALFHQADDLSHYADDALELDEHGLLSGCGYEDFIALLEAWNQFIHRA
ncbi:MULTISPECIES: YacL family protein [Pseudoalteromonas]|uniref:Uncharacterized protein n=1 Tax=Pseudoalteromonas amylolytica TaxID=1859457 RepID=A0A1S1N1T0_9GAMM|nr:MULTISPECIES: YacL family protein [Pseudoalteromonas]MCF6434820.1 YacL family protein [Pseudoalteromonas sp. MMG022]OHU90816.1 hypothetical protein BFC16_04245 [Pseudoalteromonas sp. JW3]OHU92564.1 hypothetical protein BET10_03645 [Pseudoalteromonas amylolytica]